MNCNYLDKICKKILNSRCDEKIALTWLVANIEPALVYDTCDEKLTGEFKSILPHLTNKIPECDLSCNSYITIILDYAQNRVSKNGAFIGSEYSVLLFLYSKIIKFDQERNAYIYNQDTELGQIIAKNLSELYPFFKDLNGIKTFLENFSEVLNIHLPEYYRDYAYTLKSYECIVVFYIFG